MLFQGNMNLLTFYDEVIIWVNLKSFVLTGIRQNMHEHLM